jgi:carbon storage regulator
MLVLTRKQNERIVLNNDITVEVVAIKPGVVRLGIVAPPDVRILREELLDPVPALVVEARLPPGADRVLQPAPRPRRIPTVEQEAARQCPRTEAEDFLRRLQERLGLADSSAPIRWAEVERLLLGEHEPE